MGGKSDELETEKLGDSASSIQRSASLVRWEVDGKTQSLVVRDQAILGSSQQADIRFEDPTVSRLHAELRNADGHLWIRDLGSKNGTFANGLQVKDASLPGGATIQVGQSSLFVDEAPQKTQIRLWPDHKFGSLLGRSAAMRELFAVLAKIAPTESTVLILGETGTGKEEVARTIHSASKRRDQPLVIADCGALPANLLDAELFGYKRGAFTGAREDRVGLVGAAAGGTLFLDEIGDMPLQLQSKLLRLLESGEFRPVGENQYQQADIRVLAATHRDLQRMVNEGTFREDLFFRLDGIRINVPPLSERPEDIPLLAEKFTTDSGRPLDPGLVQSLTTRSWPGNIRQLRNIVRRSQLIGPEAAFDGTESAVVPLDYATAREAAIAAFEARFVERVLLEYGSRISEAARATGVSRTYLHKLIKRAKDEGKV